MASVQPRSRRTTMFWSTSIFHIILFGFALLLAGGIFAAAQSFRNWQVNHVVPPLAPWQSRHIAYLHLDGRSQSLSTPFGRSGEAFIYGAADAPGSQPLPVGFLSYHARTFGPLVWDAIAQLLTTDFKIQLRAKSQLVSIAKRLADGQCRARVRGLCCTRHAGSRLWKMAKNRPTGHDPNSPCST